MKSIALTFLLAFATTTANSQNFYSVTNLGTLGGIESYSKGINELNQIYGASAVNGDIDHGVVWSAGEVTDYGAGQITGINDSGSVTGFSFVAGSGYESYAIIGGVKSYIGGLGYNYVDTVSYVINNSNTVVGTSRGAGGTIQAFTWNPTSGISALSGLPIASMAMNINDNGVIIVNSGVSSDDNKAFIGTSGEFRRLANVGGSQSAYYSSQTANLNNLGQVIGRSSDYKDASLGTAWFPVLWNADGSVQKISILGGFDGYLYDINDAGIIVGEYLNSSGQRRGFIWNGGVSTDLNDLIEPNSDWTITSASGINNAGFISATGVNTIGESRALFLSVSPVPEPETYGMMLMGIGMLGFMARRQRAIKLN